MENYKAGGEKGNSNLFATNRLFKKSPLFRKRKKKAPGVYDPKAKYRFDKGGEKNKCKDGEYWDGEKCTRLITYGTDQKLIDGVANWAMHSADPDKIDSRYNDQIKHYLYSGKYGYDPVNMSLIPLKTIDKKLISEPDEETKAIREKEKITEKKYFEEIKKDEAYNKALVDEPKYADEGLDFVKGWHDSPMYNQMVLNSFHGNQLGADYLTKLRKENIADVPPINIMATSGTTPYGFNPAATSDSETGEVKVYPEGFGWGPSIYTHEYFHTSDKPRGIYNWDFINSEDPRFPNDKERSNERVMPESDQMYITRNRGSNWKDNQDYKSRVEKWPEAYNMPTDEKIKKILYSQDVTEDDKDFQKSFNNLKNIIQTNHKISTDTNQKEWKTFAHDYVSQPTEVRARLGEIRYQAKKDGIYDPFIEQITPEIFQNYINKRRSRKNWIDSMSPIQDLRKQFTDEEILWMLQNISKNDEGEEEIKVAARGGALLTKKVTCKKCGWKWDAADGGDDITTCHKCGGKGLVHAKNGGLNKFVGGGPTDCGQGMVWSDELQDCVREQAIHSVTINQYTPYINAWNEMHPEQREVEQKKAEFLRKAKGLNKTFGVNADNFPQNVLDNIYKTIDRERNNYVITQYAKDKGFNPNKHVDLVENIAEKGRFGYDMAQNSKYGSKLAPSLWARSLAGAQELGNFVVKQLPGEQGDVFKYKVPGLSKKERKQIADSKTGALESTAIINLPGQIIANQVAKYVKPIFGGTGADSRDQDMPGVLSGQYIPGVDDAAATLLNPLTYTGLTSGLIGGPNVLKTALPIAKNVFNKTLDAADYVNKLSLNKVKNLITTPKINYLNKPSVFKDVVNNAELGQVLAINGLTNAALDSKDNINDIISGNTNKNTYKDLGFNILDGVISGSKFSPLSNLTAVKNFRNSYGLADSGYKAATGTDNLKDDFSLIKSLGLFKRKEGGPNNNYIETELTPEEIEEYRKGGYVIEDISVPSLSHMDEGGSLNEFAGGGENGKDKKKRKWLRGKQKGMYVSEDDPNLQRYDYLEGLNMTAEEFSEKYPNFSSSALSFPEVKVTPQLSKEGQKLYDQAYKSVQNFNFKVAGYPNYSNNSNDWTGPNSQERADLLGAAITEYAFKNVVVPKIRAIDKAIQNATVVMDNGTGSSNKKLYTSKYLKKVEAEYEKWLKAPEGDDRQVGNPAYWAPGQLKSAFSVDTYGNGTWTPGYGPRRQPASAANNYNDGPLEGFHPEVLALGPQGLLGAGAEVLTGTSEIMAPYLATEIAGISGATAGNALTAYGIGKAGTNATGNIIEGNYWDAGYDAGKGLLTALPLTKFGNASLYPELNNWRSALSFGTSGIDASLAPSLFNDFNAIRKAPNSYVSPISVPSSSPSVFSTVVGKLKKQKGGAIEKNMSKSEIKKLIAQGYVIEEI